MTSSEIKFVPKGWGYEKWIVNTEDYCGKLLFFEEGKRCSWHYHKIKDEVFYLQSGKMIVKFSEQDDLGNLEGNLFKLFRLWRDFDGVTTIEKATLILEQLVEKDLVRVYQATDQSEEEKQFLHIPNHRQRVRYFKKLFPVSPYQTDEELNKINDLKMIVIKIWFL